MTFDAVDASKGRWREILSAFGINGRTLSQKHGPCPICAGKDRFRIIDFQDGRWVCNQCQPQTGDGFDLLEKVKGVSFKDVCEWVKQRAGAFPVEKPKPEVTAEQVKAESKKLLGVSSRAVKGGQIDEYLKSRAINLPKIPADLRYIERINEGDGVYGCMVAIIRDAGGNGASLHKTFLDGPKKADIPSQRKVMRGPLPNGGAIRMGGLAETIGVAEGIETALSASLMRGLPVWSVLNTSMLEKFTPPAEVKRLLIFGDNDPKFGGQKSAFALAHRLAVDPDCEIEIEVFIPERLGDWNDVLQIECGATE